MNNKKNIIRIISFLSVLLSIFLLVAIFNINENNNTKAETNYSATLSVSASNTGTANYIDTTDLGYNTNTSFVPDGNNNIYITIKLDQAIDGEAKVKFHAEDRTAIAERGDYTYTGATKDSTYLGTHEQIEVVLNASNNFTYSINYKTKTSSIITKNTDGKYVKPTFYFVIDEVVNANLPAQKKYACCLNYNDLLYLSKNSNGYYATFYDYIYTRSIGSGDFQGSWSDSGYLLYDLNGFTASEVYNDLVSTNLAYLYTYVGVDVDTWGFIANMHKFTADMYISSGYYYKISSFYDDWFNHSDTKQLSPDGAKDYFDNWCRVERYMGYYYNLDCYNEAGIDRWISASINTKIIDTEQQILNNVYVDYSSVGSDGTIRLMLSYNEPVQVYGSEDTIKKLAIIGYLNGITAVKFNYAGGSLTNTLIFEAKIGTGDLANENIQINKIKLDKLENCQLIGDLGKNKSGTPNFYKKGLADSLFTSSTLFKGTQEVTTSIDLRVPVIRVNSKGNTSTASSRDVAITVEKMKEGKIYYSWLTTDTLGQITEDNAWDSKEIKQASNDTHSITLSSMDNMNGQYYLHVLVVSSYGKSKELVIQAKTSTGGDAGAFKFDSKALDMDSEIAFDSLLAKTFNVSIDDNKYSYEAKVDKVYISIAKNDDYSDAVDYAIYTNGQQQKAQLRNDGYILKSNLKYYYRAKENTTYNLLNDNYYKLQFGSSATVKDMYFSSKEKAIEYLKFYEYQDLEIVESDEVRTNFDNCAESGYTTNTIDSTQIWIKYKNTNFQFNDAANANHTYSYYLYKSDVTSFESQIDINYLANNCTTLNKAIDAIIDKILSNTEYCKEIDLFDDDNNTTNEGSVPTITNFYSFDNGITESKNRTNNLNDVNSYKESLTFKDDRIYMTSDGGTFTYTLTASDVDNAKIKLADNAYGIFYIGFYAVDEAGNSNKNKMVYYDYKFDRRPNFDSDVSSSNQEVDSYDDSIKVYDVYKDNTLNDISLTFTAKSSEDITGYTMGISYIKYKGVELDLTKLTDYSNVFTLTPFGTNVDMTVKTSGVGYYEIEFTLTPPGSTTSQISKTYKFYVTNGFNEETTNYKTSKESSVLNNYVYVINQKYYYMDKRGVVNYVPYGYYYYENDDSVVLNTNFTAFSSKEEALDFVTLMEYRDFELVTITKYMADCLNGNANDPDYVRADGVTDTALPNQVWIKYKRKSWTTKSSTYDWVYYYCGPEGTTTISTNLKDSDPLKIAVNLISQTIVDSGYYLDLVGEYTDQFGAPYLDKTQIHPNKVTFKKTMTGVTLNPALTYTGDSNIYQNTVYSPVLQNNVPIATNLSLYNSLITETKNSELVTKYSKNITQLYYARVTDTDAQLIWDKVKFNNGDILKNSLASALTGVYKIREYDINGVKEYYVYIDNTAPYLTISFNDAVNNASHSAQISDENNGTRFSAKNFIIKITDEDKSYEADTLSYIALYKYNKSTLIKVYYFSDLIGGNSVSLEEGEYDCVVSDRSGNSYKFSILINSEELKLTVKLVNNSYVAVSTNRTVDQIYRYEVYLNNSTLPIDNEYDGTVKKYKEGGYYRIYVEDIYGFKLEENGEGGQGYQFERELPVVSWAYQKLNGEYAKYVEGKTNVIQIAESLGGKFYLNSSKRLRFFLGDDTHDYTQYAYTVTGIKSEYVKANALRNNEVTINSDDNFTLEIYYINYPEVKKTFIVTFDKTAPDINLTFESATYLKPEDNPKDADNYLENLLANCQTGDKFVPSSIKYIESTSETNSISEGDHADSNLITLKVSDSSGVRKLEIYIDDVLYLIYDKDVDLNKVKETEKDKYLKATDLSNITLSRYGTYIIKATDIFENTSTKSFINNELNTLDLFIDDKEIDDNTKDDLYGNSSIVYNIYKDGLFAIRFNDTLGNSVVLLYQIEKGVVTESYYECIEYQTKNNGVLQGYVLTKKTKQTLNADSEIIKVEDPIFRASDVGKKVDKWYKVENLEDYEGNAITDIAVSFKYNKDNNISIKIEYTGQFKQIETRMSYEDSVEPLYFNTFLSHEKSTVNIKKTETDIYSLIDDTINYCNFSFLIDDSFINDINSTITEIEMAYSDINVFKDYTKVYPINALDQYNNETIVLNMLSTEENGFYSIRIKNIYGNISEYIVNRSDVFNVLTSATYKDNTLVKYTTKYTGVTKSNYSVKVEAYSSSANYTVYKDGELYTNYSPTTKTPFVITLVEEGSYTVSVIDNFGNVSTKELEIKNTNIKETDSIKLLSGFNTKAIKLSENYTNQLITINKSSLDALKVAYIEIFKVGNEKSVIIQDDINQTGVALDDSKLINLIGSDGDGEYNIIFRDAYGSSITKNVHYSGTSTLTVSRKTRYAKDAELVDLINALTEGIWCNNSITFNTTSTSYIYKVDDIDSLCNSTIALSVASGNGNIDHKVYYLDEYGYEYSFDIHLYRTDLQLELKDSVETFVVNTIQTTKDNIVLNYTDGLTCKYTLDGEGPYIYKTDSSLYKDGLYVFTVEDKAGNVKTIQVNKDTLVEYMLYVQEEDRELVNGDVTNYNYIKFKDVNNDGAYIDKLYIDGVLQADSNQNSFSQPATYTLFVKDPVGNEQVFEFTIIRHDLKEFHYQTPNTYIITELWYGIGDGNTQDFINSGCVNESLNKSYSLLDCTENGEYTVVMTSETYSNIITFSFVVNNIPPQIELSGCEEGEKTIEDVTVKGCKAGDTIEIYKNGELAQKVTISKQSEVPVITEGGNYRIVVTNQAGVSSTLEFKHIYVTSPAGSALIIILCITAAAGIIAGAVMRNKQKFDE